MGLFDNNDEERRNEVVINTPKEETNTRLSKEVSSKLSKEESSEDITLEDVHDQNKRIIQLLEELKGEPSKEQPEQDEIRGGMSELL